MDNLTKAGAEKMAARIERYWEAKGDHISISINDESGCAVVRSNMVNGLPMERIVSSGKESAVQ